ncbi:MAG TPA: discoidin domain-containing protein, partial [Tepidisphaeraceae bacterium]|nr:discoidin domain-containing protein [Tepidisphaeraceae bacterium]
EDWQYTDTESMYLESYAPQSAGAALNWRWMGMGLFEVANADPSSETDVYSRDAHYGVNYDSAGNLAWTLKGVTLNPMKYPNDPRIDYTGLDTGFDGLNARALTQVVRIQGRRFLVTVSKNVETLNFFRFDEANQGEIAIHSAAIAANDGSTSFIWTDTDGDGAIEQAEKGTGVWAKKLVNPFVDTNGNVWWPAYWGGNAYLHYIPFGGFDARGNPIYSAANAASVAVPSFYEIRDVSYDAAADAVYVMGYTKAAPRSDTPWYGKGNTIARISNWSTGNRTPDWQVAVPYKVTLAEINSQYTTYIPMTMTVAGGNSGHVFVGYGSFEDVHIYKASDGSYAGVLYPDAAAVGDEARKILVDVPRGWQVTKRSNGQYVVFIEDDLNGKITTVQWTPGQHAAPSAPANVTWRQQGTSNIHLTWDTATGTDSYAVRRASSPDGAYTTVGVARGANSREFTDVGLAAGTTYYYKVVALNAGGESAGAPAHAVRTASPFRGAAWAVPGRIEAEDFDRGGQGAGYHDLTPTNVDGHYRPSEAVEIRPSGDAGGGYAVWVEDFAGGEYVNYTINVAAAGYYDLGARVKVAQAQGHALQFLLDGETLGAPVTVFTGNAPEAQTFTAPGVYLPAGDHQLRVVFNGHQILLNYLTITPSQTFINDAVPDGATTSTVGGDGWNWVAGSPAPASGTLAHASNDTGTTAGEHTHAFFGAATPMYVQQGSLLWAQVYLDATSTPDQVMLQWRTTDGSWEHRAYWGANALALGTDNTGKNHPSRYQVSPNTPLKGRWMTIGVPASAVGLEGQYVDGMAFTLNKGKATWDAAGGGTAAPPSYPVNVTPRPISTERVDLSWGAALTATGYNVYRGTAPGVYGSTPINASPLTATSYTDLNLTPSTRYYYVVRAINAAGTSIASDEVSASTYAPGFGKLTGTLIGTPGSYDANSTPDKAVDGNLSTFYDGRTANGNWIGLDLGAATTVTRIAFAPRASFGYRMNGGKFQASNAADFSAGVIDLYTIPSAPTAGVLTTVDVTPAEGYRYVRYVGPANSYGEVAEMEYWRVPAAAPTVTTSAAALAYTENDA